MKPRRKPWGRIVKRWAPLVAGGLALQVNLTGCDPEVRNAVLDGLNTSITGMFSSIMNAFFLSLQDAATTSQPVAKALFEDLPNWLA
ncbi:MAG: hypothetical protein ABII12_11545 [Planctomycetota bacterium]